MNEELDALLLDRSAGWFLAASARSSTSALAGGVNGPASLSADGERMAIGDTMPRRPSLFLAHVCRP